MPSSLYDRDLLDTFLKRLHLTGALAVPPGDLEAAVDDHVARIPVVVPREEHGA